MKSSIQLKTVLCSSWKGGGMFNCIAPRWVVRLLAYYRFPLKNSIDCRKVLMNFTLPSPPPPPPRDLKSQNFLIGRFLRAKNFQTERVNYFCDKCIKKCINHCRDVYTNVFPNQLEIFQTIWKFSRPSGNIHEKTRYLGIFNRQFFGFFAKFRDFEAILGHFRQF